MLSIAIGIMVLLIGAAIISTILALLTGWECFLKLAYGCVLVVALIVTIGGAIALFVVGANGG